MGGNLLFDHPTEIHQQQPRMMPKHQCRCGVLFRSVQAIKRFKNRVVAAKRSIFGTGFPSFSSHHQFEAQAAVVSDPHDVDGMLIDSMEDYDFMDLEDVSWSMEDLEEKQPAIISSSPAVTLIQEVESSDCTDNFQNQTLSPSSDLIEYNSSPGNKWTLSVLENLELSEVNNNLPELSFPDILDEPAEGVISTTTLATTSYNNYNYGSETAPRVTMVQHTATTAYYGMGSGNYVTGSSAQNYDLMSQMLMRDGGLQIITPPSPRRWCVLKLIVWACKRLRFSRLTLLSARGPSQSLVTTACQQGLKRRREEISEDFEGVRCRKKESGKIWVAEIRMTTKTNGPGGGKVWLGSFFTCEEAARAFDVGRMFCSKAARSFNFPDSPRILTPYKDTINQLPIPQKKIAIKALAKQYGETGSINASHYLFSRQ